MLDVPPARSAVRQVDCDCFQRPGLPRSGRDWYAAVEFSDAYRVTEPGNCVTHDEFGVDEPVWLTPSDVAGGRDTVEAALQWISSQ